MLAGLAGADDAYRVEGTKLEKHAQQVFSGVFGQCRVANQKANGVVALVFAVEPSGRFKATSTFKESAGRDVFREVARCMGERANQARPFPKGERAFVGVKYEVSGDGKLLMLGAGSAATLSESEIFAWARLSPDTPSSIRE